MRTAVLRRVVAAIVGLGLLCAPTALAQDIPVTKSGNTGPGTLRDAITQANAVPGNDRIVFAPANNQLTLGELLIQPTTLLPTVTGGLTIDGTSFRDASGGPLVRIDGSRFAGASWGIVFNVADPAAINAVKAVSLTGWNAASAPALKLQGTVPVAVTGSVIGTAGINPSTGNSVGVEMGNNSTIGGTGDGDANVVSGNGMGIRVNGGGAGSIVGNLIGTSRAGDAALANTGAGIRVENAFVTISGKHDLRQRRRGDDRRRRLARRHLR